MDIREEIELQSCPYCGGAGLLEEENGWSWYAVCVDCGSQTASLEYRTPEECADAARRVAHLWNIGKIIRHNAGD